MEDARRTTKYVCTSMRSSDQQQQNNNKATTQQTTQHEQQQNSSTGKQKGCALAPHIKVTLLLMACMMVQV